MDDSNLFVIRQIYRGWPVCVGRVMNQCDEILALHETDRRLAEPIGGLLRGQGSLLGGQGNLLPRKTKEEQSFML